MIECNDPGLGYLRALGREERHLVPELGPPPRKPNDHTLGPPVIHALGEGHESRGRYARGPMYRLPVAAAKPWLE